MYTPTKTKIELLPLNHVPSNKEEILEWADAQGLKNHQEWLLPQLVAFCGGFKVPSNKPLELLAANIKSAWEVGLWRLATAPRGCLVTNQSANKTSATYGGLTPLILYGLKKYQNIPYSFWSKEGLEHLVGEDLASAMCYEPPELTVSDLLLLRDSACMVKSGPRSGTLQKATSVWRPSGLKGTSLGLAPRMAQCMLLQLWLAHPSIRSDAMILNPSDWDNMPEPLIDSTIFQDEVAKPPVKVKTSKELPWL